MSGVCLGVQIIMVVYSTHTLNNRIKNEAHAHKLYLLCVCAKHKKNLRAKEISRKYGQDQKNCSAIKGLNGIMFPNSKENMKERERETERKRVRERGTM